MTCLNVPQVMTLIGQGALMMGAVAMAATASLGRFGRRWLLWPAGIAVLPPAVLTLLIWRPDGGQWVAVGLIAAELAAAVAWAVAVVRRGLRRGAAR